MCTQLQSEQRNSIRRPSQRQRRKRKRDSSKNRRATHNTKQGDMLRKKYSLTHTIGNIKNISVCTVH